MSGEDQARKQKNAPVLAVQREATLKVIRNGLKDRVEILDFYHDKEAHP